MDGETAPARSSLDEAWERRRLPPELLERARGAGVREAFLERMLFWDAPPERIEQEVRWTELLREGVIRARQVHAGDNDAFCELWANSPEAIGDWDVTIERGPDGFAQFELQERPVLNALFDRQQMVACVSFSNRVTVAAARRISVRYGQAMRVHRDHRRHGYGNWVRSIPWAIGLGRPSEVQYDFIRARNMAMEAWNRKHMPAVDAVPKRDDDVPGLPVTVQQYPARPASVPRGIRPARADDLEACAALINRTHAGRDLFRPYTAERLGDRLDPGWVLDRGPHPWRQPYALDDVLVIEQRGRVVACAGLWDRGRDVRERWRHRESGAERVVSATNLLDFGCARGAEEALAELIAALIGRTHDLGRTHLVAPLEGLPAVASLLESAAPQAETRYLQWRTESPAIKTPIYLDLVYW